MWYRIMGKTKRQDSQFIYQTVSDYHIGSMSLVWFLRPILYTFESSRYKSERPRLDMDTDS